MAAKTKNSIMLYSTFHVKAELKVSMAHLKSVLDGVAYLKPVSYGTSMKYLLFPFEQKYNCYIEFTKNHIKYSFSFPAPSEFEYSRNLLAFLSILSFLRVCYETDFSSIYAYLVEALRIVSALSPKSNSIGIDAFIKRNEELGRSNSMLAKDVLSLQCKAAHLNDRIKALSSFIGSVVGTVPRLPNGLHNTPAVASAFGIDSKSVQEALEAMEAGEKDGTCK